MSGLERNTPVDLIGDGTTTNYDFGVPVKSITTVQDANDYSLPLARWRQTETGVRFTPPLAVGERVTVWFLSDYL